MKQPLQSVRQLAKAVLPLSLQDIVRVNRGARGALGEHRRLERLAYELGPEHVAHTRVYAGRVELLKSFARGGDVAEVGVAQGRFSELIIKHCKPRRLYLIDFWNSRRETYSERALSEVKSKFASRIQDGSVVILRGWSSDMIKLIDDGSLDCIYIDADHSYESVRKDLLAARSKLKPGGVIAGHDYVKWSSQAGRFGVVEAVNEFCLTHRYELIGLTLQRDMYLSYAIRLMDSAQHAAPIPSKL